MGKYLKAKRKMSEEKAPVSSTKSGGRDVVKQAFMYVGMYGGVATVQTKEKKF